MDDLLSGRSILVVEDEMLVLMNTENMLADLGCESVSAAATVDQALALIDGQVFDAAMLDMNLNGDKTHIIADSLAAHGVPFLFATGYVGDDMRNGYRDRPVLKKPFGDADLLKIMTALLPRSPVGA